MKDHGFLKFLGGAFVGAIAGYAAGTLLAPRSGAESRAMAVDAMNDAWDSAMDTYDHGARVVNDKLNDLRPQVDVATDELRAKVDAARERVEQLRVSLSDTVAETSQQVSGAVQSVADKVNATLEELQQATSTAAESVRIEPVPAEETPEEAE
ncbi:MAG: YtxH domain-containing protein [Atopobiaceae bacterium]|nr:YtxH domain-containing protein [Atopobiaceae bacterium]